MGRRKGTGRVQWHRNGAGYLSIRGVLVHKGRRYITESIGIGHEMPRSKRERERLEAVIEIRLAQIRAAIADDTIDQRPMAKIALSEHLAHWIDVAASRMLPPGLAEYRRAFVQRVAPYQIAHIALGSLEPIHVERWLVELAKTGRTTYQLASTHAMLMTALRGLVGDTRTQFPGIVAILATVRDRQPRHRKQGARPFDAAERGKLMRHLALGTDEPFSTFYALCLYAGLRFSEGAALPWGEIHDTEESLTVRWQIDRRTRTPREPKSRAGVRTVPLVPEAVALLHAHRKREKAAGRPCGSADLVFVARSRDGSMRELGYASARRHLAKLCEAAGLPAEGRTHVLRHTFGTVAGAGGVPRHLLKTVMGHADERTAAIYTTTLDEDSRRVIGERLGKALRGVSEDGKRTTKRTTRPG